MQYNNNNNVGDVCWLYDMIFPASLLMRFRESDHTKNILSAGSLWWGIERVGEQSDEKQQQKRDLFQQ